MGVCGRVAPRSALCVRNRRIFTGGLRFLIRLVRFILGEPNANSSDDSHAADQKSYLHDKEREGSASIVTVQETHMFVKQPNEFDMDGTYASTPNTLLYVM